MADQAALEQWKTCSPILILGSHTWNTPGPRGNIIAGRERQDKLLQATRYRYSLQAMVLETITLPLTLFVFLSFMIGDNFCNHMYITSMEYKFLT